MKKKVNIPLRGLIIGLSFVAAHICVAIYHNGVKDGQATLHAHVKAVK